MNPNQIQSFIIRFIELYHCTIIERTTFSITCKLSVEADRELSNRPYYWNFVDRLGMEPETLTYTFIFDPQLIASTHSVSPHFRAIQANVQFGSPLLQQMMTMVQRQGRFVHLYEKPTSVSEREFERWLAVTYKISYVCDRKRFELWSYGISMKTGELIDNFYPYIRGLDLSAKMPDDFQLHPSTLTLHQALEQTEQALVQRIESQNHEWAQVAYNQWQAELTQAIRYYNQVKLNSKPEDIGQIDVQSEKRQTEITRQYQPRICFTTTQCGLFHLFPRLKHK